MAVVWVVTIFTSCRHDDSGPYVSLDFHELSLAAGERFILVATVMSDEAPERSVLWSSNNSSVATVNDAGEVTAIAEGTAVITVTVKGGRKIDDCNVTVHAPAVYVAGYVCNEQGYRVAALWKDGVAYPPLSEGLYNTEARSVCVWNGNVFAVGYANYGVGLADAALKWTGWQSEFYGYADAFAYGSQPTYAHSVCASNYGELYIAGLERNTRGYSMAVIWENGGQPHYLSDGTRDAFARSICLSGDDVYIAGNENNARRISVATLWKWNRMMYSQEYEVQRLTDGARSSYVQSVCAWNDNIYASGYESNAQGIMVAALWKNGEIQLLTDGVYNALARSVYVSYDGDVYAAGYEGNEQAGSVAALWKNGEKQLLAGVTRRTSAESVYVWDGNVYVAGYEYNSRTGKSVAILWKNGVEQRLTDGARNAEALSVYIK